MAAGVRAACRRVAGWRGVAGGAGPVRARSPAAATGRSHAAVAPSAVPETRPARPPNRPRRAMGRVVRPGASVTGTSVSPRQLDGGARREDEVEVRAPIAEHDEIHAATRPAAPPRARSRRRSPGPRPRTATRCAVGTGPDQLGRARPRQQLAGGRQLLPRSDEQHAARPAGPRAARSARTPSVPP